MPEQRPASRRKTVRSNDQDQLAQLGRLQPQAVELEKAVLGACIIEQDAFAAKYAEEEAPEEVPF